MKVTLKEIAKRSGFSVTTVSRALGGHNDVNEETRQLIISIANQLGYHPNLVARQLQRQKSDTIGIVTTVQQDAAEDDFFSILIKGIGYAAAQYHHDILLSTQYPNHNEIDTYRRLIGGNRVDGVVVARTTVNDERIRYLQSVQHPFVVAGRLGIDETSDFVYIDADGRTGIRDLVNHFVDYGHRDIGFISSPDHLAFTGYRLLGYQEGLAQADIDFNSDYVTHADLTRAGGHRATQHLLDQNPQLTAIVASNDLMAIGAMRAIQARNLRVGVDIAVGGFDNIPAASHEAPSLTTVSQPIFEIGERLAIMLIKMIQERGVEDKHVLINPTLIIRESSGKPRY